MPKKDYSDLVVPEAGMLEDLNAEIRGSILTRTIDLEYAVDRIVAWHYCGTATDDWQRFIEVFLSRMQFDRKLDALMDLQGTYPQQFGDARQLKIDITDIKRKRDLIAHRMLDRSKMPSDWKQGQIRLVTYGTGPRVAETLTLKAVRKMEESCERLQQVLLMIEFEIHARNPQPPAVSVRRISQSWDLVPP